MPALLQSLRLCRSILAVALALLPASTAAAEPVDLELVLAIDCSYSVDRREYALQARGLAAAFRSEEIIRAVGQGQQGAIAVAVVQWSHEDSPVVALPWFRIDGRAAALTLAAKLTRMPRLTQDGATSISGAIRFATGLLERSPYSGTRQVIDVSADGRNNNGRKVGPARAEALARGITINGLAIVNDVPTLDLYFQREIIGGSGAFVVKALNYRHYITAIHRKILNEIQNLPLSQGPAKVQSAGR